MGDSTKLLFPAKRVPAIRQVMMPRDTNAVGTYHLHRVRIDEGRLSVGDEVELLVDEPARRATERTALGPTTPSLLPEAQPAPSGSTASHSSDSLSQDGL